MAMKRRVVKILDVLSHPNTQLQTPPKKQTKTKIYLPTTVILYKFAQKASPARF